MKRKSLRARLMLVVSPVITVSFCVGNQVNADVIFVDVNSQAPNPNGSGWPSALPDLQAALDVCGLDAGGLPTEVWVKEGVYSALGSFILPDFCGVYGGFNGTETLRDQRDWKANVTTLTGDGPVVQRLSPSLGAALDGFVITGGVATFENSDAIGGGIYLLTGKLTVRNCIITSNFAEFLGGGIGLDDQSTLEISNSVICSNNVSSGFGFGGGIVAEGQSTVKSYNCRITGNTAWQAGGVCLISVPLGVAGSLFANTLIDNNDANRLAGLDSVQPLSLINCTIVNNHASGTAFGDFGGVHLSEDTFISNTIIWGNTSATPLGKQLALSGGTTVVRSSDIEGGAIAVWSGGLSASWTGTQAISARSQLMISQNS